MLKPLLLLFFCVGVYWLTAQDLLLRTTESLRNNTVRIAVRFQNGSLQHGFGFITGEKNGVLFLATAAHVIHGESFDQQPSQIQVWFYSDLLAYAAKEVSFFEAQDLAILQLNKPSTVSYQQENWANFSLQNNQSVRFIGRDQDWLIPAQGEIYKFDNERIYAYMPTVHPGTSGAPLVSEKGIVGLIIEDDDSEVTAISLSKVRDLFTQGGRFPYFSVGAPVISNPGVRPLITEDDLATYSMVKIDGGTFEMGCKPERDGNSGSDETLHQVSVNSFYLSKYEVTNAEFVLFLNAIANQITLDANASQVTYQGRVIFEVFCGTKKGGCSLFKEQIYYSAGDRPGGSFTVVAGYERHPAVMVSKYGAEAYCTWLSNKTGNTYRLPTEAEWEFAARGGLSSQHYKYAGANEMDGIGWHISNSGGTSHPVGQKKSNELGLFDMSGNVNEWCSDWYEYGYYTNSPSTNPQGPASGARAVLRGCAWTFYAFVDCYRLALRNASDPDSCDYSTGFRIARNL